jgi:hypothetical protein
VSGFCGRDHALQVKVLMVQIGVPGSGTGNL